MLSAMFQSPWFSTSTPMMAILTSMGQLTWVISGVCWYTSYSAVPPLHFIWWWSGVMVRWLLMVKWWWRDYFFAEIQFWHWVEFYCWSDFCPPGKFSWEKIFIGSNFVFPGQNNVGHVPWDGPRSFRSPVQHLTHYWDANCPERCLGISWYFCTYNDTDFISLHAKVCVRYDMFICIRLQYAPGICPNISQGTRAPYGTRRWSSFIFGNGRPKIPEQTPWWHRAKKTVWHVFMFSTDQYKKSAPGAVQYCRIHVYYLIQKKFPPSCTLYNRRFPLYWDNV